MKYQSDNIGELSAALCKAQIAMSNAIYNRENPHFRSKYADLASVRHATMEHLGAHGITLTQTSGWDEEGRYVLFTKLILGEQYLIDVQPLLYAPDKPQSMTSSRTYNRRAGWTSICGIAVEGEDDDGNAAHGKTITTTQIDELMDIVECRNVDTSVALPWISEQVGYKVENLSMVLRDDMNKVRGWLERAKQGPAMLGKARQG